MEFVLRVLEGSVSIILVLIPLSIPVVREFVIKRYQLSLNKVLEDKKTINERKNYISKVKFDKEFEIYTTLTSFTTEMVFKSGEINYYLGGKISVEEFKLEFSKLVTFRNSFNRYLMTYGAFMQEKLFNENINVLEISNRLLQLTDRYLIMVTNNEAGVEFKMPYTLYMLEKEDGFLKGKFTKEELEKEIVKVRKELTDTAENYMENLRNYLNSLEVIG